MSRLLALALVGLLGCSGGIPKEEIEEGVEGARDFQNFAAPCIGNAQKAEEAACAGDAACIARVEEKYENAAAKPMKAFHKLWCWVAPKSEGC